MFRPFFSTLDLNLFKNPELILCSCLLSTSKIAFSTLNTCFLNVSGSGMLPIADDISFPRIPSNAAIILLSVGTHVPESHFLMSFKEAPVKDAICLLDKPLSSFNLANTVEKFSIKTNCIQYIYFYTISLNNGGE